MFGIVTILEGEPGDQVKRLWNDLAASCGADTVGGFNLPHFSYHVADDYNRESVRALLERLASLTEQFTVPAAGLAFNTGPNTILYINMVRTPPLSTLHDAIWDDATTAGTGVEMRYHRDVWLPHVTLSYAPSVLGVLPHLAGILREGKLPRKIPINNLALIEETGTGHEIRIRVTLQSRRGARETP